jgi:hypothetical protein
MFDTIKPGMIIQDIKGDLFVAIPTQNNKLAFICFNKSKYIRNSFPKEDIKCVLDLYDNNYENIASGKMIYDSRFNKKGLLLQNKVGTIIRVVNHDINVIYFDACYIPSTGRKKYEVNNTPFNPEIWDIYEGPNPFITEVTMQEIADKFGIPVENLKIKK